MAITIGSSFHLAAAVPIDDRFVVADNTARDALAAGVRYEGLIVYSIGAGVMYQLVGGILDVNWTPIGGGGGSTPTVDLFSGDGVTVDFTLAVDPGSEDNTFVFVEGVYQQKDTYSVSGTTLTFSEAPVTGTNNVQVVSGSTSVVGVPGDGTVTSPKLAANALDSRTLLNAAIKASVSGNAMLLELKGADGNDPSPTNPVKIAFRDLDETLGTPVILDVTAALNTTISSGSTAGTVSAAMSRIYLYAINNAGAVELAWTTTNHWNNENSLISTTAEGGAGAADSSTPIYSTTARTTVPFRYLGYIESTQATAGTWATSPSRVALHTESLPNNRAIYHYDTANGYGATNTVIRMFANNTRTYDPSGLLTISNTDGFSVKANRPCEINIGYTENMTSQDPFGISKNTPVGGGITTAIQSITKSQRVALAYVNVAGDSVQVNLQDWCLPGDTYRPHTDGGVASVSANLQIYIFAREI